MSTWRTTTKRRLPARHRRRTAGSAALAAIGAMMLCMILGLAMLRATGGVFASGERSMRQQGARYLAEAGIEYGYWQYAFNYQALPYSVTRSLGDGSFTVTVTDNSASTVGTVKIVSTGAKDGQTFSLTRVMKSDKSVFEYALSGNTSSITTRRVITGASGADGDVRVNGSLSWTNTSSRVNGDAVATGSINSGLAVSGQKTPNFNALNYPAIDLTYYRTLAQSMSRYSPASYTTNDVRFNQPYEVAYINGNLTLNGGVISGTGTVVVTGQLIINGNYSYELPSHKAAFLVMGGIDASTRGDIVGIYYTHNSGNTATAICGATGASWKLTITKGSLAADRISFNNDTTVYGDPDMTPALAQALRLPGYY